MNKAMKELESFKAKRAAQLEENTKTIEGLTAEIELTKKAALDATSAGDTAAYAATLDKRTELERKLEVMKEFRQTALENYTTGTDPVVMKIWEKYSADYDKLIAPKIAQMIKLRAELFALTMDVLQLQDEAINDRGLIARCFSKDSGINGLSAARTLPFKTSFEPPKWDHFREVFAEDLDDHNNPASFYSHMFAAARRWSR
jgi:hypothetical protein